MTPEDRVRAAGRKLAASRRALDLASAEMNAAIRDARAENVGLDRLARWSGLTKSAVQARVNRLEKDS